MLVPDLNALMPQPTVKPTAKTANLNAATMGQGKDGGQDKEALKSSAQDFEAAFIAQMLTHSGLAESMTSGEGKMAAAFGSFYVEQLAERMADQGGLGMADSIYRQLERYSETDLTGGDT